MLHFLHRYAPLYPHTVQSIRGGTVGTGADAVRYDGCVGARLAMPWCGRVSADRVERGPLTLSSISAASPFRYRIAVRTFIVDFFFLAALTVGNVRLSEITVCLARNFDFWLDEASGSESGSFSNDEAA